MSTRLVSLCFDANDPAGLARFWASALDWDIDPQNAEEIDLVPTDGATFGFSFVRKPEPKTWKNRIHLHLVTESPEHQTEITSAG